MGTRLGLLARVAGLLFAVTAVGCRSGATGQDAHLAASASAVVLDGGDGSTRRDAAHDALSPPRRARHGDAGTPDAMTDAAADAPVPSVPRPTVWPFDGAQVTSQDVDHDGRLDWIAAVGDGYAPVQFVAHARADGTASLDDEIARVFVRGTCPWRPEEILVAEDEGSASTPNDRVLIERRAVCMRVWGVPASEVLSRLARAAADGVPQSMEAGATDAQPSARRPLDAEQFPVDAIRAIVAHDPPITLRERPDPELPATWPRSGPDAGDAAGLDARDVPAPVEHS
ncbi:MAG: hypothetical protein WCJ30_01370, partial [Deltaproteobacteria bacterium]